MIELRFKQHRPHTSTENCVRCISFEDIVLDYVRDAGLRPERLRPRLGLAPLLGVLGKKKRQLPISWQSIRGPSLVAFQETIHALKCAGVSVSALKESEERELRALGLLCDAFEDRALDEDGASFADAIRSVVLAALQGKGPHWWEELEEIVVEAGTTLHLGLGDWLTALAGRGVSVSVSVFDDEKSTLASGYAETFWRYLENPRRAALRPQALAIHQHPAFDYVETAAEQGLDSLAAEFRRLVPGLERGDKVVIFAPKHWHAALGQKLGEISLDALPANSSSLHDALLAYADILRARWALTSTQHLSTRVAGVDQLFFAGQSRFAEMLSGLLSEGIPYLGAQSFESASVKKFYEGLRFNENKNAFGLGQGRLADWFSVLAKALRAQLKAFEIEPPQWSSSVSRGLLLLDRACAEFKNSRGIFHYHEFREYFALWLRQSEASSSSRLCAKHYEVLEPPVEGSVRRAKHSIWFFPEQWFEGESPSFLHEGLRSKLNSLAGATVWPSQSSWFGETVGGSATVYRLNLCLAQCEEHLLVLSQKKNEVDDNEVLYWLQKTLGPAQKNALPKERKRSATFSLRRRGMLRAGLGLLPRPVLSSHHHTLREQLAHKALSPSRLDEFASCSYRGFAKSILKVEGRYGMSLGASAAESGRATHEALRLMYEKLQGLPFSGEMPEISWFEDLVESSFDSLLDGVVLHPARVAGVKRELVRYCQNMIRVDLAANIGAWPLVHEYAFGLPGAEGRMLELSNLGESGLNLLLRGSIDRLERHDGILSIVDYKRSHQKRVDGRHLQLALYALVALRDFPEAEVRVGWRYFRESGRGAMGWVDSLSGEAAALVDTARDWLGERCDLIATGRIEPDPAPVSRCERCEVRPLCRVENTDVFDSEGRL